MYERLMTVVGLTLMTMGLTIGTLIIAVCCYIWNYGPAAGLTFAIGLGMALLGGFMTIMADR